MSLIFNIHSGVINACDSSTGLVVWARSFNGHPVYSVLMLKDGDGCLVLVDYSSSTVPICRNLFRVGIDGSIIWTAGLLPFGDSYASIRFDNDSVIANTWGGWVVSVNVADGGVTQIKFTQ